MDLWDLAKLMWRRWYLMAPMILLTVAGTGWALATIKPDYTSTGTIMLLPPADRTPLTNAELVSTNTWTEVGEDIMATAVTISVNTQATRTEIAADGFEPTYEVISEARSSIITIEATAPTPELAQATVQRVQKQIEFEVQDKQARFKPRPGRAITTQVLDGGDTIEVVTSKIKRAAVVIVGVGLLLTAAITIVGDILLRRRTAARGQRRRDERDGDLQPGADMDVLDSNGEYAPSTMRIPTGTPIPSMATAMAAAGKANVNSSGANGLNGANGQPIGVGTVAGGQAKVNGKAAVGSNAGLTVSYRQGDESNGIQPAVRQPVESARASVEVARQHHEPDDATIVLPLSSTPWAGREKDSEARKR